jgi:tetratricopeptide (TPR) repeat protein
VITRTLFAWLALSAMLPALLAQTAAPGAEEEQQWLNRGAQALQHGQTAEALQLFRKVVAAAPGQPDGYLGLGMAELRGGDGAAAARDLQEAVRLNPRAPGAHLFLGIALYQLSRYDDSAAALEAELKMQPESVETLTWLGMAELAAGHPELATVPLDHAARLTPKDANVLSYRARAHTQVAQQSYQALYELDPGSWQLHLALAELHSAAKQHELAIAEYKAALTERSDNPDIYEALGLELQKLGRHDEAEQAYQQALRLNPHAPISLFNLGKIRIEKEDPAAGVPLLRQAIAAHAPAAASDYYLGYGLAQQNNFSESVEWLEKSLNEQPPDLIRQNAWYTLARVYQKLGRAQDSQHAIEEFKQLKAQNAGRNEEPKHEGRN